MSTVRRSAVVVLAILLVVALGACGKKEADTPKLDPKIAPPLIGEAGTLRVGLDTDYVPFCGTVEDGYAGLDVDLSAALAERLGLKLEIIDVKQDAIGSALESGTVDIVLGGTPMSAAALASVSTAGSYLVDGPAIFAIETSESVVPTITVSQLSGLRVAVQNESVSFWTFEFDYGEGFAIPYATLREAFEAVKAGQADVVVGDAAVCAYIARDFPEFGFAGQFGSAQPIGIAVKKDAVELEQEIRATLDAISADGVLSSITKKWLGTFPALQVEQTQ